jgi:catechol 2,3-dioxygenase-like lactoylglutathione lyase family enzyme
MKVPFKVGTVGHFGLAVRNPKKSAKWFERALGLKKEFEFGGGVAIGNDNVTIALHKGKPSKSAGALEEDWRGSGRSG